MLATTEGRQGRGQGLDQVHEPLTRYKLELYMSILNARTLSLSPKELPGNTKKQVLEMK